MKNADLKERKSKWSYIQTKNLSYNVGNSSIKQVFNIKKNFRNLLYLKILSLMGSKIPIRWLFLIILLKRFDFHVYAGSQLVDKIKLGHLGKHRWLRLKN